MEEMTLDEWVANVIEELEIFRAVWKKKQGKDPDEHPDSMAYYDWYQEFDYFTEDDDA